MIELAHACILSTEEEEEEEKKRERIRDRASLIEKKA